MHRSSLTFATCASICRCSPAQSRVTFDHLASIRIAYSLALCPLQRSHLRSRILLHIPGADAELVEFRRPSEGYRIERPAQWEETGATHCHATQDMSEHQIRIHFRTHIRPILRLILISEPTLSCVSALPTCQVCPSLAMLVIYWEQRYSQHACRDV